MADKTQNILTWEVPEFVHYEKNIGWYITLYAITILLIGYELYEQDIFGAVTIFIIAAFLHLFSRHKPRTINVKLSLQGIHVNAIHVPYKNIRHFWVVHTTTHRTLNMVTTAYFHNEIILDLGDQNPERVRAFLLPHVREHEFTQPTFVQKIIHLLKF